MARDSKQKFFDIARELRPRTRKAFLRAVQSTANAVSFADLVTAIDTGNIEVAVDLMRLSPDTFEAVSDVLRTAYVAGGALAVDTIPVGQLNPQGRRVKRGSIVFSGTRPIEAAEHMSLFNSLITNISPPEELATREIIARGIENGVHPRTIARDLVGVVDATGQRAGGVIGLTDKDKLMVQSVRDGFRDIANNGGRVNSYFNLESRNKTLDKQVRAAVANDRAARAAGRSVKFDEKLLTRMTNTITNKSLFRRGEAIARTHMLGAIDKGRVSGYNRLADDGLIDPQTITKVWDAIGDRLTRPDHNSMNGQVVAFDEPFVAPDGSRLAHPRDATLGAPAEQIVNCRCHAAIKVDYLDNRNLVQ